MLEPPTSVIPLFTATGWVPGRRVAVDRGVPTDHPAAAILAEFGGLQVRRGSDTRSDIAFKHHDTSRDPLFILWQDLLKTKLVYVGQSNGGHEYFLVDHCGRWFQANVMNCAIEFVGYAFAEAVERILMIGMQDFNRRLPRSSRPTPNPPAASGLLDRASRSLEIPLSVRPLVIAAGWTPERRILVYRGVPSNHPAAAILAALGSLHINKTDNEGEYDGFDIEFGWDDIEGDRLLTHWQSLLGIHFVLVGQIYRRHGYLLVDDLGRCFSSYLVSPGFGFHGYTFGEALEKILLCLLPFERSSRDPRLDWCSAARRNRAAGPI